jgi:glycosyltransferase involved in cell wall biosynthesis
MQKTFHIRPETGRQKFSHPRIALVHYWYFRHRGGERVFDVLADIFPNADIFFICYDQKALSSSLRHHKISSSFLNRLPQVRKYYRSLLPFFPIALEQFDLSGYDIVISHEAGPAKGIITRPDTRHICYCHTPMRYLWDMYHEYLSTAPGAIGKLVYTLSCHYVRNWDYQASARVDQFIASSQNSAKRIQKYYRRDAEVIYPPVDTAKYAIAERPSSDFYLVVSPLVNYKRINLAIEACNRLKRNLVVIGDGEQARSLRRIAGPTVTFLGFQPDEVVSRHYSNCRALLFPGEEDIGLTPIEAQAAGRPVIAYGKGGVLETVKEVSPGKYSVPEKSSGVFFQEQTVDSLIEAMLEFERLEGEFSPLFIRSQVLMFDQRHFKRKFAELAQVEWQDNSTKREPKKPVSAD